MLCSENSFPYKNSVSYVFSSYHEKCARVNKLDFKSICAIFFFNTTSRNLFCAILVALAMGMCNAAVEGMMLNEVEWWRMMGNDGESDMIRDEWNYFCFVVDSHFNCAVLCSVCYAVSVTFIFLLVFFFGSIKWRTFYVNGNEMPANALMAIDTARVSRIGLLIVGQNDTSCRSGVDTVTVQIC